MSRSDTPIAVPVYGKALRDPRFKRLGKAIGMGHHEALGRCLQVWALCYERHSPNLCGEDVDIAAEFTGFSQAMVAADLALEAGDQGFFLRGVTDRIEYLEGQSKNGRVSGRSRRELRDELLNRTNVQRSFSGPFNDRSTIVQRPVEPRARARGDLQRSSDLGSDPDPNENTDLHHETPGRTRVASPESRRSAPRDGGQQSPGGTPIVAPVASQAVPAQSQGRIPDPPDEALTLSILLLDHVIRNNPGSRAAVTASSEKRRDAITVRGAWVIEKLHRIDKQSWGAIHGMIEWGAAHHWWCRVILGADALRENWDKMLAQRTRDTANKGRAAPPPPRKPGPTAQALDEVEALEKAEAEDQASGVDTTRIVAVE